MAELHAFDLVTGEPYGRLDVSQLQWSERINARLDLSCRLDLAHRPSRELAPSLLPGRTKLVLVDGPIVKSFILWETSYTERRFLNLRAAGLWSWFQQMPLQRFFRFNNREQFEIAAELINWAQAPAQGGGIGVDVDISPPSGVLRDRTYRRFEFAPVGQRVDELAAVNGGFDFAIDSTFDGNVTVTDTWRPSYPRAGTTWPASALQVDAQNAAELTVDESAPIRAILEVGAGEGVDQIDAALGVTPSPYPPLWKVVSRKTVERQATLFNHARRDFELHNRQTEAWAVTVMDKYDALKGLTVGDEANITVAPGDFRFPDGTEEVRRVIGRSVSVPDDGGPERVALTLENRE